MVNIFACFGGGKSKATGNADPPKQPSSVLAGAPVGGAVATAHANAAGAAAGAEYRANEAVGNVANAGQSAAEAAAAVMNAAAAAGKQGRHDPGPGRTPPAGLDANPDAHEKSGVGEDGAMGGGAGGAGMTDDVHDAQFAAIEEEQHRRLVVRVTKWVEDAQSHAHEMMSLAVDLSTLRNIEDFSNPDPNAPHADSVPDERGTPAASRQGTVENRTRSGGGDMSVDSH